MDPSSFQELCKFLESERKGLASLESTNEFDDDPLSSIEKNLPRLVKNIAPKKVKKPTVHVQTASKTNCALCNGNHVLFKCNAYSSKSVEDRKAFISQKHLCYKCLGNHMLKDCKSKFQCFVCQGINPWL